MLYNYVIVAGFLLKIKLVSLFLCCNRGARKSRFRGASESWQTTLGTLWSAAWPGLGKGPLVAHLMHQRRSSWPHLSLPCPMPLQCPVLHGLELALEGTILQHLTSHLCHVPLASCLLPQGHSILSPHMCKPEVGDGIQWSYASLLPPE